jgi:hypothetical protein
MAAPVAKHRSFAAVLTFSHNNSPVKIR